jgi:hypothetical protein
VDGLNTREVIERATRHLHGLPGNIFDVLAVARPISPEFAVNLAKVISKLSPLLGNLIEFHTVDLLNRQDEFHPFGRWVRQDPGFPDTIFSGVVDPTPGFEIKAWFPLATEITARFRDSQNHFREDNTYVAVLAWLPDMVIFGRPRILDVCVVSGASVARARDAHYHNPPDYLVIEPEDTTARTRNLQQTNTTGQKFQGTPAQFAEAQRIVAGWGEGGREYRPTPECQARLRELSARFPYRLDTNFAKMGRIVHAEIEAFKRRVLGTAIHGQTVQAWANLLSSGNDAAIRVALETRLGITGTEAARAPR